MLATVAITSPAGGGRSSRANLERMACVADRDLMRFCGTRCCDFGIDAAGGAENQEIDATILGLMALENLMALRHVAIIPCLRRPSDTEAARQTLAEEFAKLEAMPWPWMQSWPRPNRISPGWRMRPVTWRLKPGGRGAEISAVRSENEDKAHTLMWVKMVRVSNREERDAFGALLEQDRLFPKK